MHYRSKIRSDQIFFIFNKNKTNTINRHCFEYTTTLTVIICKNKKTVSVSITQKCGHVDMKINWIHLSK